MRRLQMKGSLAPVRGPRVSFFGQQKQEALEVQEEQEEEQEGQRLQTRPPAPVRAPGVPAPGPGPGERVARYTRISRSLDASSICRRGQLRVCTDPDKSPGPICTLCNRN